MNWTLQAFYLNSTAWRGDKPRVLVVNRVDAQSRRIANHAEMMDMLRADHPEADFVPFIGTRYTTGTFLEQSLNRTRLLITCMFDVLAAQSIEIFQGVDIVVAPHGAALAFMTFLRPGQPLSSPQSPQSATCS